MGRVFHLSIKMRILVLPLVCLVGLAALQAFNLIQTSALMHGKLAPLFEAQLVDSHKQTLKCTVDAMARGIEAKLTPGMSADETAALVVRETDAPRFYDDQSGYFFSYTLDGTRVNVPTNKDGNGKNFWDLTDKKGTKLIQDLTRAAQAGGGFVTYYFEKPGKGVQPKLSYARLIAGTKIFIGAGVYIDNVEEEKAALNTMMNDASRAGTMRSLGIFGVLLLLTVGVSLAVSRSISGPVERAVADLTAGAEHVTAAAREISETSDHLAQSATTQAAGLQETASSLEEIATMTARSAENAEAARGLAREARRRAEVGGEALQQMNAAIGEIRTSADETATIIKVIDEIAFQTNLLALNAAVEAARAGEAGKGFAVVAEEVRNLAQRSAEAARETSAMIERSVAKAGQGVEITARVTQALTQVVEGVVKTDDLVGSIAENTRGQSESISQLNVAVGQIDQMTQHNAANAEESAGASRELQSQAEVVRRVVRDLACLVEGGEPTGWSHADTTAVEGLIDSVRGRQRV
ncbi:MAG: methyl-accepting chemotaxis protein [Candidatus Krumholzibacteriia bacterium]